MDGLMKRQLLLILAAVLVAASASCGDDSSIAADFPSDTLAGSAPTTPTAPPTSSHGTATVPTFLTTTTVPPTTNPPPATCSALGMSRELPAQTELPDAAAVTRQAIVDAAIACNWDALRDLAAASGREFVYSFGGGDDPVSYWQSLEPSTNGPLRAMVIVLRAPFRAFDTAGGSGFAWPEAFEADPLTDAHLLPLAELYTVEDFARFREFGGYVGWRVGINSDGTWRYFVAGD
jgi:hypothetical protein